MARYVLPVVGAVVGFIYGGPTGAMWGWSLGAAIGGAVDPQVIKGPSIGDLAQQTSQEGVPRPIVFGVSVPIAGNIIASAEPRIVRKKKGGKGGPKVKTESVFRTYAIRICEGPIDGVLRVWRNNQLVYDARPGSGMTADNIEFLKVARFFLGTFTQNPSPDLEAAFGVGNTPAHRGTAYMVMANEDLTDFRGAIPQFVFQVSSSGGLEVTQTIDLDAVSNAGATETAGIAAGFTLTGFVAGDRLIMKPNHAGPFIAYSPWGVPALGGPNTGTTYDFHVAGNALAANAQTFVAAGAPFDGYVAARDAFESQFPAGVEVTGFTSYAFYIVDTPIADNSGGISLTITIVKAAVEVSLPAVVQAICVRAGMPVGVVDVSDLSGTVHGITIVNSYPAFTALRSLSEVFFFLPSNYDGVLHFIPGGANSVATIVETDMLDDVDGEIEQSERDDSIAVPRVMHLNYYDVAGGLATDKQTSERAGDRRSLGEMSMQSAVVMNANQAARVVAKNHKIAIEESRGSLKFGLPDSFIGLVPTDPVIVQYNGRSSRVRIGKLEVLEGYQQYEMIHDRQSAYTSIVEGIPAAPQTPPPSQIVGPTMIQPLDIHILRDVDDGLGFMYYVAVSGQTEAWTGALVELSLDGGLNYISSQTADASAVMGTLDLPLGDHPQEFPDEVNALAVSIVTPFAELDETDLAGMQNRLNFAIVGDEIIQFANAQETTVEGHWELSHLLRGRKGTTPVAHPAGTRFVLLDVGYLGVIPASVTDVGRTLTFRATSFGTDESTATVISMLYTGRAQIEREVGYLMARIEGSPPQAIVSWQGIGRLGSGAQVAHGARFDGYRVEFDDGSAPVITVNTTLQAITQDVSALSQPIQIRVMQLNELTGAGPVIEVIL